MSFKFLKINFHISVPFAVIITFLLITDSTGYMTASLIAAALHEIGHIVAMKLTHCAPSSVNCGLGGVTIIGNSFTKTGDSVFITLSGPVINLLAAALLFVVGWFSNNLIAFAFAAVQFLVGVVNLLPVRGLDGGTVLEILLQRQNRFNPQLVCTIVSIFVACAVLTVGLCVAIKNVSNPSLLLLGLYLIMINGYRYIS